MKAGAGWFTEVFVFILAAVIDVVKGENCALMSADTSALAFRPDERGADAAQGASQYLCISFYSLSAKLTGRLLFSGPCCPLGQVSVGNELDFQTTADCPRILLERSQRRGMLTRSFQA